MKYTKIGLLFSAILFSGCTTVLNYGSMVDVPVETTPSGATIVVNNTTYTTPTTVQIPRGKGDFTLHIEKEGFQSIDIPLKQSIHGFVLANGFYGGVIGFAVDFITRSAYDIEPEIIKENLKGINMSRSDKGTLKFILVDINQLPKAIAKQLKEKKRI